jgi:hypothetical protein
LSAGQCRTDLALLLGVINGKTLSEKALARLNPRIDVAPKSRVDGVIEALL